MAATTPAPPRIATLDIVRGVAVMGILAMNILAFAMHPAAYANPFAYGAAGTLDLAAYGFNFIVFDGKMRGLFSFLFGASMLLVIERAAAAGQNSAAVHFSRQFWLLVIGALHFYLIWYGDILFGYALIGMVAWFFRRLDAGRLIVMGILLVMVQLAIMGGLAFAAAGMAESIAAGTATPQDLQSWKEMSEYFAVPSPAAIEKDMALHLGPWTGIAADQLINHSFDPLIFTGMFGWETLAYMLFGMAGLKSGFLTGAWSDQRYRRVALIGFGIGIPAYAVFLALIVRAEFGVASLFTWLLAATVPVRPLMVVAFAALIILMTRGGGRLVDRIAATGRAAFTNYLGTSILMTGIFYGWGLGLYGSLGRAELWLVVILGWALMLAWSKPWLDRFAYGPLEWVWRSLSRWQMQPIRRRPLPGARTAEA